MARAVWMVAFALTVGTACSSSGDASSSSGATSTLVAASTVASAPEGTTGCEGMPEQSVPLVADQDVIVGLAVYPWPEGPVASFGQPGADYPSEWIAGFEAAKATILLPLPAPGPDGCCSRPGPYALFIDFQSGARAVYGPCELPGGLDVVAADLYDAAY
ncbi:MAG: hypothetical protein HY828_12795 [Actinobacteria bacterium]|nr:hypothetical protein [Actinomycetota bacterium]